MKRCYFILWLFISSAALAQDSANYAKSEIIYGRKDGMALTMLKLSPLNHAKGKALISIVSGNWISNYNMSNSFMRHSITYVNSGYTIFLVMHGSQPRYTITDEIEDIKRAVRFIRYNAKTYEIDPDHIGITGASSGGHLALMTALGDENINAGAKDPIDRISSRVQAAAVFYPPVDFLNWGGLNTGLQRQMLIRARVAAAFDFKQINDTTGLYESIRNDETNLKTAREISPIYSVSPDDPPVLIAHGDSDPIVPIQQSRSIIQKLKEAGVPHDFIIKAGGMHGWRDTEAEEIKFLAWFDKYLK